MFAGVIMRGRVAKQLRKVAGGVEVDKRYKARKVNANPRVEVKVGNEKRFIIFCANDGFKKYKQLKKNFHKKPQIIIPIEKILSKRQMRLRNVK